MTAAVIVLAVLNVALIALVGVILRLHSSERERRDAAWTEERRELLNRVQAPERIPMPQVLMPIPELEDDDSAQVGMITYDETYGTEDGE